MNLRSFPRHRAVPTIIGVSLAGLLATASVAGAATPSGRGFPGASGSVAAITGASMEVQSQSSGQTTVTWTSSTTFSQTASVALSAVTVGDCVTVIGSTSKGAITARTVTISQPTSGTCGTRGGFGAGGFGGARGSSGSTPGGGGSRPSFGGEGGPPSGGEGGSSGARAGGGAGFGRGGAGFGKDFGFASGKVTNVSGQTVTVSGTSSASFGKRSAAQLKKLKKNTKPKTTTVKIKTTSSTTYSENQSATATNLAVGDCVTAIGSTSSTGSVSAKNVQITSTGSKTCTSGAFGGFNGG